MMIASGPKSSFANRQGERAIGMLVAIAMLVVLIAPVVSPAVAAAGVTHGPYTSASNADYRHDITIDSPRVTDANVEAGSILVAQLVATSQDSLNTVWICPLESGWTQMDRVATNGSIVQHIWWRAVTQPQTEFTAYAFESRSGEACDPDDNQVAAMTGAITLYTGVDTDSPMAALISSAGDSAGRLATAPTTPTSHAAGSRVARFFGADNNVDINTNPIDGSRLYAVSAGSEGGDRAVAAFDTVLGVAGPAGAFPVNLFRSAYWVATTVVLNEPSAPGEPADTTAPVTIATSAPYIAGSWTNADSVDISLSASDPGGSGVKEIVYGATGSTPIEMTTVAGAVASLSISAEAVTEISYFARDIDGNTEAAQTFVVRIDRSPPNLSGTASTAPNASGWHTSPVTVTFQCDDDLSSIASCTDPQQLTADGANQTVIGTAIDQAGNRASDIVTVNIDQTTPILSVSRTPDANANGWNNTSVTVRAECADATSGIVACPTPHVVGEGRNQTVALAVSDRAGNTASARVAGINVDLTAPSIGAAATTADGQPYVSGRWTNQPVTIAFTCSDSMSGLTQPCPEPVVVSASTAAAGMSIVAGITDLAGNASTSDAITVMVDMDAPRFTFVPVDVVVEVHSAVDAVVTWATPLAVDAIAGAIEPVCLPGSGATLPLGPTLITCTVTDPAGNSTMATFTVNVIDIEPPALDLPSDMTVPADGPRGAVVYYGVVANEIQSTSTSVCAPTSGSRFQIGTTIVECRATNLSGTSATGSFTITVLGATDLLTTLRAGTQAVASSQAIQRALLRSLDRVDRALSAGNTFRAFVGMLQYWMQLDWCARLGRIPIADVRQLQAGARQVINALW